MKAFWGIVLATCGIGFWCCAVSADPLQFEELYGEQRDQSKTVTINPDGVPALVSFWRSDCDSCQKELPLLAQIAAKYPKLSLIVVSLEDQSHTQDYFTGNFPAKIHVLVAVNDTPTVFSAFGHEDSSLPFTMAIYGDGSVCDRHLGILKMSVVDRWVRECQ